MININATAPMVALMIATTQARAKLDAECGRSQLPKMRRQVNCFNVSNFEQMAFP